MDMTEKFDIVIGGGGFVGLALARALAVAGRGALEIALVERTGLDVSGQRAADGRASTISAASRQMLEALGVWQAVADQAQAVTSIDITDSTLDSPLRAVLLQFDAILDTNQPAAHVVENAVLLHALAESVRNSDVRVLAPAEIKVFSVEAATARLALSSGVEIRAKLLAAADGRRSKLRDMAGIKVLQHDYPQIGIVATVAHEKPHEGHAVQHFLPAGPFAILPLPGNRSSLVWTEQPGEARRVVALDEESITREIARRFGRHLGEVRLLSGPQLFPLSFSLAREFVKPHVALAGDAAHGLHWIAGQGLNHGFRDAAALTQVVVEAARLGLDFSSLGVLRRYERWRRFDAASSAMVMDALNRLFASDNLALRMVRDLGLGIVERVPPLKQFFVREAAGLTGELPRLLRGEPV